MKKMLTTLLLLLVTGCATYKHVPDGYTGPVVAISDSIDRLDSAKGEVFYIESIDGNAVKNAYGESKAASYGRGFFLSTVATNRDVRVVPMKLVLVGTHITAAPIHEFASRATGNFYSVSGEVEFLPEEGKRYRVIGALTKVEASVWVQDNDGKVVTKKITAR